MTKKTAIGIVIFCALAGLCIVTRLVDHAPNFTALAGVAMFAGFWFTRRAAAIVIVIAAMAVSDAIIGSYHPAIMATVYAAFLFPIALRSILRRRLTAGRVVGCALLSSIVFFVVTNFAVWQFMGVYSDGVGGLVSCYASALPFFKYQLAGNLCWSGMLFGGYALASRASARRWASDGDGAVAAIA